VMEKRIGWFQLWCFTKVSSRSLEKNFFFLNEYCQSPSIKW
jgi:hypothetical protein